MKESVLQANIAEPPYDMDASSSQATENAEEYEWHRIGIEMPPTTTEVELRSIDGVVTDGEIVVDMSGFSIYLNPGWGSIDDYTYWRRKNHKAK